MGYLAGVYAGDPDADEPIAWIDESGNACESTRHAQRAAAPIVLRQFLEPSDSRLWRILGLMRRGVPEAIIGGATGIDPWFLGEMGRNVALEAEVSAAGERLADPGDAGRPNCWRRQAGRVRRPRAGRPGRNDPGRVRSRRLALGLRPVYKMVDTCAAEFDADTPYFYSTYEPGDPRRRRWRGRRPRHRLWPDPDRAGDRVRLLLGPGGGRAPRCRLQRVMINSNPETVSTDFDASSRLYFEPLDAESVRIVIDNETPDGGDRLPVVVQFGGQTPLNLAAPLAAGGVPLLGSDLETIDLAEDRTRFSALLDRLGIPQPAGGMAHSMDEALTIADRIGYPVLVRPSFVLGGLAMEIFYTTTDLARQLAAATVVDPDRPVRIDKYLEGVEIEVDAVCDGEECSSRASWSTSSGPASTPATRSRSSRRTVSEGDRR